MRLRELTEKVSIRVNGDARVPWDKRDDWQKDSDSYSVTLGYGKRRMTCDFFMGKGNKGIAPTSYDLLYSLLSDASSVENARSFEEWASELGLDTDSRSAEKTYKACVKLTGKLQDLLGDDYETFLRAEQD